MRLIALSLAAFGASEPGFAKPREVPNFNLLDLNGRNHELRRAEGKAVVLFFTGNGCPIARQSVSKLKRLPRLSRSHRVSRLRRSNKSVTSSSA